MWLEHDENPYLNKPFLSVMAKHRPSAARLLVVLLDVNIVVGFVQLEECLMVVDENYFVSLCSECAGIQLNAV